LGFGDTFFNKNTTQMDRDVILHGKS